MGSGVIDPLIPRRLTTASAIKKIDSVDSISGAPNIAPTPISSLTLAADVPATRAKMGTMVSGKAVPMAAKSEPVTPSEIFNLSPRCSRQSR
ncbi:hypothetical protein D3C75_817790 [compost metagenome]